MTMRRKQMVGSKYTPALDAELDANQNRMIDYLTQPNQGRISEVLGAGHRIVSSVPAYEVQAQPVQARGRIVWNRAYSFQSHGPSYLDPTPE